MSPKHAEPGWCPPAEPRGTVRFAKPNAPAHSTPPVWLQREAEALYDRGPRPIGEIVWELIRSWGPDFEAEVRAVLGRYNRIPAATYHALGADRFPAPFASLDGSKNECA